MRRKKAVIIFTRVPSAGHTKTRMMPYLTAEECKEIHICFLRDIAAQVRRLYADLFVCYAPARPADGPEACSCSRQEGILRAIFGAGAEYFRQEGDGLGNRMEHALRRVFDRGYTSCVLAGADIPEMRSGDFRRAFRMLERRDVVFGPTADGGYYLVGMNKIHSEIFRNQSYGHGSVLKQAENALKEAGLTFGCTCIRHDLDDREDLQGFRSRLRGNALLQRTHTGRFLMRRLKISVIVPVYNEEKTIEALMRQLKPLGCEVILVDGGSTDRTLELITAKLTESGFRLLRSQKGRAAQMNLGAKASHGDVLFFLHCDSELPGHPLAQIRYVMKDHRAGCFGIAFHSGNFFMWTCRVISNQRVRDRKVMFGDQGIFIEKELFFEAGMFPELPIMEDYQFSLTLKEMGIKPGIARQRIYTSDRRFPQGTIPKLRLMWKMNRLRKMYRAGVPIERIARLYRDVR